MSEDLETRLARDPAKVECQICRHGQWLDAPEGRCDQCGSEIEIHEERAAAREAADELAGEGRLAYVARISPSDGGSDLWAVVANRRFGGKGGR